VKFHVWSMTFNTKMWFICIGTSVHFMLKHDLMFGKVIFQSWGVTMTTCCLLRVSSKALKVFKTSLLFWSNIFIMTMILQKSNSIPWIHKGDQNAYNVNVFSYEKLKHFFLNVKIWFKNSLEHLFCYFSGLDMHE